MPIANLLADLGLMPLRAVAFQALLLLVAIALEAIVLRQRLRLGYQTSVQYAATLNLLATSLGWILFLALEALLPLALRQQVISYVLFSRFFANSWTESLPVVLVVTAILAFFMTFWIKLQGLTWLISFLDRAPVVEMTPQPSSLRRYGSTRRRQPAAATQASPYTLAVLQANALSFSALVVLLLLQLMA